MSQHFDDEEMKRKASAKLYEFNMMEAIEAALDSSHIPTVSTTTLDPQVCAYFLYFLFVVSGWLSQGFNFQVEVSDHNYHST